MSRIRYAQRQFIMRLLIGLLFAYNVGVFSNDQTPMAMVAVLITAALWLLSFDF